MQVLSRGRAILAKLLSELADEPVAEAARPAAEVSRASAEVPRVSAEVPRASAEGPRADEGRPDDDAHIPAQARRTGWPLLDEWPAPPDGVRHD